MNTVTNDVLQKEYNSSNGGDENTHHNNNNVIEAHRTTASTTETLSDTAFRSAEKKYKLYKPTKVGKKLIPAPETDLSEVLDFRNIENGNSEANRRMIKRVTVVNRDQNKNQDNNNNDDDKKCNVDMYTFDGLPGLVFLPNFLSVKEQRYWMSRSLDEFSGWPYPNNETTLVLNQQRERRMKTEKENEESKEEKTSETNETPSSEQDKKDIEILSRKGYRNGLRWATLGYTYNWSTKTYHPEQRSPFPSELGSLVKTIVHDHFSAAFPPESLRLAENYEGQTSIVNYFPVGSQMCAHQDVSEAAMEKPLVSISLGCSSVFLMGTNSREDKPFAMFLRSGDVVVFSGPTRDAYHAVPRILDDCPSYFFKNNDSDGNSIDDDHDSNATEIFTPPPPGLRVNINVRQVFDENHGADKLPSMKDFYCMKTANALKRKLQREEEEEKK